MSRRKKESLRPPVLTRSFLQLCSGPQCSLHTERPAVQQMCLSLSAPKPFHPSGAPLCLGRPGHRLLSEREGSSLIWLQVRRCHRPKKIRRGDPRKTRLRCSLDIFYFFGLSFSLRVRFKTDITGNQNPFSPSKTLQNMSGF